MKLFKLIATNIEHNYVTEECYFTSKDKAYESYRYVINYLIKNHSLDTGNVLVETLLDGKIHMTTLDGQFKVSVTEHQRKTQVLKYV